MSSSTFRIRLIHALAGAAIIAVGLGGAYASGGTPGVGLIALYVAVGLLVAIVPAWYVSHTIARPLEELRQAIATTRSDGDLARKVELPAGSGIQPAAQAYNELIATFHGIVSRIVFNSKEVASAAEALIRHAEGTADSSKRQSAAADATAEAVAEMSAGVQAVARNADETARIAETAREQSEQGAIIVKDAAAEIERIARSVAQAAKVVTALGERSEAISGIVQSIHEIADQTNLLALNAAIEAARAGEQGRGFAVVADEVRKLAERTTDATTQITTMIAAIQAETKSAITTIEEGSTQAHNGAALARRAAEALDQINHGAQDTMEKVALIAQAMAQNSARTRDIAENVTEIMGSADSNSESAQNTLAEARQLDFLAINLAEVGKIFKLGEAGDSAMRVHEKMPGIVREAAQRVGRLLEDAIDRGQLSLEDAFDKNYLPIANTRPPKFHTRYDTLTDQLLPQIQEAIVEGRPELAYAIACDTGGYVPTHNRRFSQPLTGDERKDFVGNRSKRIFDDPVGKRCGAHEQPSLLQTYRRDTGEIMHDISAPIYVKGRHWGGFRIGYRTE
jgi:methyl-accepting chemotaxis protein